MSVVILGGNECMERRYKDLCQSYKCSAKVFTKPSGGLKNKLGSPDLMIFFTSTMSHKLVQSALSELKGTPTRIERCHTSSLSALRSILENTPVKEEPLCPKKWSCASARLPWPVSRPEVSFPVPARTGMHCWTRCGS